MMLATAKQHAFHEIISGASYEELVWMNGFLAGVLSSTGVAETGQAVVAAAPAARTPARITMVYGTETGNAKSLAMRLVATAKQKGIGVKVAAMDQYRLGDLAKEQYFVVVVSTQGDGELPAAAVKFHEHVKSTGNSLEHLTYTVLGLGDSAYPLFCKAGEDVDRLLEEKGGRRLLPLQKCDTDYEETAGAWFDEVLRTLGQAQQTSAEPGPAVVVKTAGGKKVHAGTVLTNIDLNDRGSAKETRHIEIAAEGLAYAPGDSIGIIPRNPEPVVAHILALTGADPERTIHYRQEDTTLRDLLQQKLNIIHLSERTVRKYAEIVQQEIPATRIGLADLLKIYPVRDAAQFEEVVDVLETITPRLYSISSAPSAHEGEVHITVARDTFHVHDELKYGLCSSYLVAIEEEGPLSFYVHPNRSFRLPAPDKDMIMIGPGTGIAPFRSFLWEREATMAPGRNWLFFGDQHFTTDFLYQTEVLNWFETGLLTKINAAFSRDQEEKVYVQHKMLAHGAELFNWLENGACLYVCGAREPMSMDVERTLLRIIAEHGNKTEDGAEAYLQELKETARYQKDVY